MPGQGEGSNPEIPLLEVNNLSVSLPRGGDRPFAVEDISFNIAKGETLCIVGESGSGKSVIAQSIIGMLPIALPVTKGAISLRGQKLPGQRDIAYNAIRSTQISMIFQEAVTSLDPVQRIKTQLNEILRTHGFRNRSQNRTAINRMLDAVQLPEPERIANSFPHQLSGGQAQRVVIAGSLILNPSLLIADEPTTALDVTTQAEILKLIVSLSKQQGTSVLFITHDFGIVGQIADRIIVLKDGNIVEHGTRTKIFSSPEHPYTKDLLQAASYRPGAISANQKSSLLEAKCLSLSYSMGRMINRKKVMALQDVSIDLKEGEILSIVGESGSGKSSLAKCLLRLENVDQGTILYRGRDITNTRGKDLKDIRKKIQVVFQDPFSSLNPRQKILDTIAEGPIIHGVSKHEAHERSYEMLEATGLSKQSAERYPHEFSGGQRQRICIARALVIKPEILIADEAVSALDVSIQTQILNLFRDLQHHYGFTMIFITHDLRVARSISARMIVMKNGQVVETGPSHEIFSTPRDSYTKALFQAAPPDIKTYREAVS
ncbi:MAG: ABC transporter ATP-binding protein [Rhodobacteraceae bacterium]|nr:ABC transporter ATP-binding protein [Paracoccaceae bacterium]